jgi:hypothetical protein
MALTYTIGGADKTAYVAAQTLNVTGVLNARDVCRFTTRDTTGAYKPSVGQEVIIADGATRYFAGTIDSTTERVQAGTSILICECQCVDYNQFCDRHLVAQIYENQTLKEIVEDIVARDLAGEGVTTVNVQTGLTITKAVFNYETVTDAFNELAELTGYSWSIDYSKDLHFFARETNYALVAITGANARNFSVRSTRDQYRNRQYVRAGYALTAPRTESFVGDGTRKSFNLAFPCGKVPSAITVDATPKTIGIREVETDKDFYWQKGETAISQDDAAGALTDLEILAVTYQGQYPLLVDNRNSPEIASRAAVEGGTGLYEAIQDESDYDDDSLAIDKGNALLRKYGRIGKTVTFETDEDGLQAGQLVNITLSELVLSGAYLISQIVTRDATGLGGLRYKVTALDGEDLGGWVEFFRKLSAAGQKFVIRENEVLLMLRYTRDEVKCGDTLTATAAAPIPSSPTKFPGTAGNDASVGTTAWTDPDNVKVDDGDVSYVRHDIDDVIYTNYLKCTNFGFSVPTDATVTGVEVAIKRRSRGFDSVKDSEVKLVVAGTVCTTNKANVSANWPTVSLATASYGGASDTWDESLSPSQVNASDFGVVLSAELGLRMADGYADVDCISIVIHYGR